MKSLTVQNKVTIDASPEKVWKVLTLPKFIRQWDELPEDFGDNPLADGTEILWQQPDGNITKLTVTNFSENRLLKMNLYVSRWANPEASYDIAYTYKITDIGGASELEITIGDFGILPSGQNYYDASLDFGNTGLEKIKTLAEQE